MSEQLGLEAETPKKKRNSKTPSTTRAGRAHSNKARPKRISMSAGMKLDVPPEFMDDTEFYYRWINDKKGRIQKAIRAGYEHVKDELGGNFMYPGDPDMYLMKLPMPYRKEDELAKEQKIINTMKQEQKLSDGEYIPEGKKGVIQKDEDLLDPLA
jgi:hypothetical protein